MHKLILVLIANILCLGSFANRDAVILTNTTSWTDVTPYIEYYEDSALNTPIAFIADSANTKIFKPVTDRIINLRNNGNAYWLHFYVVNQSNLDHWMLNVDFPTLNEVTLYVLNDDGNLDTIMYGGIENSQYNKLGDYTSVTHPFNCNPGQKLQLYLKVRTSAIFMLPIKVMTVESYIQRTAINHSLMGLLGGIILASLLINILLFAQAREKHSFLLLLLLISISLFLCYQYGFEKLTMSFITEFIRLRMRLIIIGFLHLFFALFTIQFLDLLKYKNLYRVFQGISSLLVLYLFLVLLPFVPAFLFTEFNPYISLLLFLICTGSAVFTMLKFNRQARIYLISVISLLISSIIWILFIQNIVPNNFFTSHIVLIAVSVFSMLLTLGSMEKIAHLRIVQEKTTQLESMNQLLKHEIEMRKEAEQKSRESEVKYLDLLENIVEVIFSLDAEGNLLFINPSVRKKYGLEPSDMIGKHFRDYFPFDQEVFLGGNKLMSDHHDTSVENELITVNGEKRFIQTSTRAIFENGRFSGCNGIITDITDKKLYELELLKNEDIMKELITTKDKFFSIVAHDLMNPFNALLGYSEFLVESIKSKNNEQSLDYAKNIQISSKRLFELTQNLLLWSRAQSGRIKCNPTLTDIKVLIDGAISTIITATQNKNINIEIEVGNNTQVVIDQQLISMVIRNLVWNAVKYSNHGVITIQTEIKENELLCMVADTGIGMSEDALNKLFKIDYMYSYNGTAQETGSGLGLYICKEFIHIHNGKFWVESTLGKGSKFSFSIPLDGCV